MKVTSARADRLCVVERSGAAEFRTMGERSGRRRFRTMEWDVRITLYKGYYARRIIYSRDVIRALTSSSIRPT